MAKINKMEQPSQQEISKAVKIAFNDLREKMKGRDLMFKDGSGNERFYAISSPAGTINLFNYDNKLTYTLWEDGHLEMSDDSDPEKFPSEPTAEELEQIMNEIASLEEEEMETP